MSPLRSALDQYVLMRRGLGHKFQSQERQLIDFVAFMDSRGAGIITYKLALEWATLPAERHHSWPWRLSHVRGFARHMVNMESQTEIPPVNALPHPRRAIKPHIYTEDEIRALLAAALELRPVDGFRRWTFHCLFGLLAATGLRISEATWLERQDVDLRNGVLTVRDTKFGKSRIVPIHSTTQDALLRYTARRDVSPERQSSQYFLVTERGRRLLHQYVHPVFLKLSRQIGLRGPEGCAGPRLHDFRHRFAVQTLTGWYRSGADVEALLPSLSTYLGHTCVRDTYWYLSLCPELMENVANRLDSSWEAIP